MDIKDIYKKQFKIKKAQRAELHKKLYRLKKEMEALQVLIDNTPSSPKKVMVGGLPFEEIIGGFLSVKPEKSM